MNEECCHLDCNDCPFAESTSMELVSLWTPFPRPRFRGLFRNERIIVGFLCDVDKINQDGIIYPCEDIQQYVFSVGEFEFFTGDMYKGKVINYNHLTRQFCLGEEPLHDALH